MGVDKCNETNETTLSLLKYDSRNLEKSGIVNSQYNQEYTLHQKKPPQHCLGKNKAKALIGLAPLSSQDLELKVEYGWLAGSKPQTSAENPVTLKNRLQEETPESISWRYEDQEEGTRRAHQYGVLGFFSAGKEKEMSIWQVERLNLEGSQALHCMGWLKVRHLTLGKATLRVSGMLEGNELISLPGDACTFRGWVLTRCPLKTPNL